MDELSDICSTEQFVGNVIGAFSLALSDKISLAVREATGLGNTACGAIVTIGSEPGSSIERLRRMLSLEHSSLVRLLNRLEQFDLVERRRGSCDDQRIVSVWLTPRGDECFDVILRARARVLKNVVSTLDAAEYKTILSIVDKMMPKTVQCGDDQHYVCRLCDLEMCPQEFCPVNRAFPDFFELPAVPFSRNNNSEKSESR
ncbi:MAG: MarR family winged helix-turn-helix transcriptional regulator [Rhizobiaceae bacterium]